MLTVTKLRNLKPGENAYKLTDRDGLYVTVLATGTISFRYNYRINGRQETLVLGRYGPGGITLSEARELLFEAKNGLASGKSPSRQKAREKQKVKEADSFGEWAKLWLKDHQMAESTRDMRRSAFERDLKGPFGRKHPPHLPLTGSPGQTGVSSHPGDHDVQRSSQNRILEQPCPGLARQRPQPARLLSSA